MKRQSYAIAFCALMAALGAALMTTGGLIPIATYCSPLLAGLLLLPVLVEFGVREAWMVWAVTAALSLILSPDKEAGSGTLSGRPGRAFERRRRRNGRGIMSEEEYI